MRRWATRDAPRVSAMAPFVGKLKFSRRGARPRFADVKRVSESLARGTTNGRPWNAVLSRSCSARHRAGFRDAGLAARIYPRNAGDSLMGRGRRGRVLFASACAPLYSPPCAQGKYRAGRGHRGGVFRGLDCRLHHHGQNIGSHSGFESRRAGPHAGIHFWRGARFDSRGRRLCFLWLARARGEPAGMGEKRADEADSRSRRRKAARSRPAGRRRADRQSETKEGRAGQRGAASRNRGRQRQAGRGQEDRRFPARLPRRLNPPGPSLAIRTRSIRCFPARSRRPRPDEAQGARARATRGLSR